MLKHFLAGAVTLLVSAMASAQDATPAIIGPTVIVTPHIQDLGSYDFTIGKDLSNGELVRTTVTLSLVQDSKGKLAGTATFSSNLPVNGQPQVSFPLSIPVKGNLRASAKGANFGISEPADIRLDKDEKVLLPNSVNLIAFGTFGPQFHVTSETQVTLQKDTLVLRDNSTTVTLPSDTLVLIPKNTQITYDDMSTGTLVDDLYAHVQSPVQVRLPGLRAYNVLNAAGTAYTYTLKGKIKIAGGADFHSRSVTIAINGVMDQNAPFRLNDSTLDSTIPYTSNVTVSGLSFNYNYTVSHSIQGKNWVGIKVLADASGRKALPSNAKYIEVAYPGGFEILPGYVSGTLDNATLNFKGKGITGTVNGYTINTTLPLNPQLLIPESVSFITKNGIEIMHDVIGRISQFVLIDFPLI